MIGLWRLRCEDGWEEPLGTSIELLVGCLFRTMIWGLRDDRLEKRVKSSIFGSVGGWRVRKNERER